MANFSPRTISILLLAIVLFTIAIRYPLVDHERHNDTYFADLLVRSIQQNDRAVWTFHPLSYFGYYPASYPSGNSFLIAEISDLTGLGIDLTILLSGIFFGLLFALGVFCLSRQFNVRSEYSILAAFFASAAPRLVDTSYWNGSARAPFVVLAVILVMVALRGSSARQSSLYLLVPFMIVASFALHHMAVLLMLFGLAYLLGTATYQASLRVSSVSRNRRHARFAASFIILSSGLVILIISIFILHYYGPKFVQSFENTSLFSFKPASLSAFLNLSISYVNQIGFVLVAAILGIPAVLRRQRMSATLLFLIASLFVFIPMLANSLYVSMLLAPFASILGVVWLEENIRGRRRRFAFFAAAVLILSSVALPVWSVNRWNHAQELSGEFVVGDDQSYNDGTYLSQYRGEAQSIANVDVTSRRLSGISGVVFLWTGVESALSGDVTRESIQGNITWGHRHFPENLYLWFDYENAAKLEFLIIILIINGGAFANGTGDITPNGQEYYEIHSHLLVIIDNRWIDNYVWIYAILPAVFPRQLMNAEWNEKDSKEYHPLSSYLVYRSEKTSMFAVELPD